MSYLAIVSSTSKDNLPRFLITPTYIDIPPQIYYTNIFICSKNVSLNENLRYHEYFATPTLLPDCFCLEIQILENLRKSLLVFIQKG